MTEWELLNGGFLSLHLTLLVRLAPTKLLELHLPTTVFLVEFAAIGLVKFALFDPVLILFLLLSVFQLHIELVPFFHITNVGDHFKLNITCVHIVKLLVISFARQKLQLELLDLLFDFIALLVVLVDHKDAVVLAVPA